MAIDEQKVGEAAGEQGVAITGPLYLGAMHFDSIEGVILKHNKISTNTVLTHSVMVLIHSVEAMADRLGRSYD